MRKPFRKRWELVDRRRDNGNVVSRRHYRSRRTAQRIADASNRFLPSRRVFVATVERRP